MQYYNKNKSVHPYVYSKVVQEPTCVKGGLKQYTCTSCQYTYTKPTDALGHKMDILVSTTYPTCEYNGYDTFQCSRDGCSSKEIVKNGDAYGLPHPFDVERIEPTCTEEGYLIYTCPRKGCGAEETETIPKKGHSDGNGDGKCDDCGTKMKNNYDDDEEIYIKDII